MGFGSEKGVYIVFRRIVSEVMFAAAGDLTARVG
jgi:hypothetical protein